MREWAQEIWATGQKKLLKSVDDFNGKETIHANGNCSNLSRRFYMAPDKTSEAANAIHRSTEDKR